MTRRRGASEAGFSLVEVLVTVAIVGLAFVVFVGGMGTTIVASDHHRKQAVAHASVRNFAEAVKAAPFSTECPTPAASYQRAFSPPPPERRSSAGSATSAVAHNAPSVRPLSSNSYLLAFFSLTGSPGVVRPSGMTNRWLISSNSLTESNRVTIAFSDQAVAAASPTGPRTATSTAAADSVSQLVSVQGASAAPGSVVARGATSAATPIAGAGKLTLTSPTATAAGDALFAQVAVRAVGAAVSPPAGWALVSAKSQGTAVRSLIYEKVATIAGAQSFEWTFSSPIEAVGGVASYGGASKSYDAVVTGVQFWDGASFTATCPDPTSNEVQLVSLRTTSTDGRAVEIIDVVKRCHEKPTPSEVCADSP